MNLQCKLISEFDSSIKANAAKIAISHEGSIGSRSIVKVIEKENVLEIEIKSVDVIAMRATLNAYLRALAVFEGVNKGAQNEEY